MSDEPIDLTSLLTLSTGSAKRGMINRFFGKKYETDHGIDLPIPDGEKELFWSVEECEHFMEVYLSKERAASRYQNRRKWNYPIWRFIMELYSEGLRYADIATKVSAEFTAYEVEEACNKHTIRGIVNYRGWKVGKRMKQLLSMEKAETLLARRRASAIKAEETELGVVDRLRKELEACVTVLQGLSPVEPEYNKTVSAIKSLKDIISSISGLDSIRKIEIFKEQQNIRQDMGSNEYQKESANPKTMKPTIISE